METERFVMSPNNSDRNPVAFLTRVLHRLPSKFLDLDKFYSPIKLLNPTCYVMHQPFNV